MKSNLFLVALCVLTLVACKDEKDNENPVIASVKINGETPTDHVHLDAGTDFVLEVRTTDNEELNQLKIDLHPNEDGHSHDEVGGDEGADGDWEVLEVLNLSGTSQTTTRTYSIPETIRGEWHLGISLLDAEGNEAADKFYELDMENEIIPNIEVVSINGSVVEDEVEVEEGMNIDVAGTATDSDGLDEIHVHLEDEDGNELWEMEYDANGETSFDLSAISFAVPASGTTHADFAIEATDVNGHSFSWVVEFHYD